jgi:diguanylate cyclase (GGDEF)-like protein
MLGAAVVYVLVSAALVLVEIPGLGIGHLFYLAIALAALASDHRYGAAAGLLATALYCVGIVLNPNVASHDLVTISTAIRMCTYVSTGALIGWYARSNRELVHQLRVLAETDSLTSLPNVRRFEAALLRLCRESAGFAVLVGDLDGLRTTNERDGHAAGNLLLRRAAAALEELAQDHDMTARVGGDEFAVLARVASEAEAAALCAWLEAELERRRIRISFGWSVHPADGRTAAELLRRADERLYRAKATRRSRETVGALLRGVALPAS